MLCNRTILRLPDSRIFSNEYGLNLAHAILVNDYEAIPCGSPVVLDRDYFDNPDVHELRAFPLFTSRAGMDPTNDIALPKSYFEPVSLRPLVRTHRTVTIDRFDVEKAVHIGEYVKDLGGITFVVKDESARVKLAGDLAHLPGVYKYNSMFYFNHYGRKYLRGEDDCVLGVLSFFNLPYCVPIFNTKRVDGMGVSYCQAIMKASVDKFNLIRTFRMDFVLSNFEENLFVMDGATVNPINPVSAGTFGELEKWACQTLEVRKDNPYGELDYKNFVFDSKMLEAKPGEMAIKDEAGVITINGDHKLYTTNSNVQWSYGGTSSSSTDE